jgi:hypothetical protein
VIGATALTAIFGSRPGPLTDAESAKAYVRALADAGLAVMLLHPGTKEPCDMRTPRRKQMDNTAAREAAREAGRADWERVEAPRGLYLATSDKAVLTRYVTRFYEVHPEGTALNLAIEVGRSNLVVVDADTAEQVAEFLDMCHAPADLPPTVRSPGQQNPDGTWVHRDGGHFYFTTEGLDLPPGVGSTTIGETGIAVLWANRYVLIPPSVRAEGEYELTGREYPLPQQLGQLITDRVNIRAHRAAEARARAGDDELGSRIDDWARHESWLDILGPLGWVPTAAPGACGCPQMTAPGDHASPRSATAHEAGCAAGMWTNDVNAPLHIWTTNPGEPWDTWIREHGGLATITKFQAVALTRFDGDQARAMDVLGISPRQTTVEGIDVAGIASEVATRANLSEDLPAPDAGQVGPVSQVAENEWVGPVTVVNPEAVEAAYNTAAAIDAHVEQQIEQMSLSELAGVAEPTPFPIAGTIDETTGLYIPTQAGVPQMAPFDHWRDTPPPLYVIDGLLEHGGLTALIGSPNAGKSTIALDMACHIATGRTWQGMAVLKTKVLYLPGEGLAGVVARLRAWCAARNIPSLGGDLLLGNGILQLGATREAWAELREYVATQGIGLIIFDTFARMATNIDENSASDVGKAIKRFDQVRELTHAGVMVVHHTGKANTEVARGSSALNGALDSELLIRTESARVEIPNTTQTARQIHIRVTKQKNVEYSENEINLLMINWHGEAPLITGPNGNVDPMQGEILIAPPVPEPLIETAVRVRLFVDRFPEQGLTRTDIAAGVAADAYTAMLNNSAQKWKLKIAEAIDRSLTWGLLNTPEGSSARYVPGPTSIAEAQHAAAEEVMIPDAF